jgi:carboxymethylenebutenolidase
VTTAIAQFMRELERVWDDHRDALPVRRDVNGSLAHLAADPSVSHLPAMTGATGRPALERFYAEDFLPHLPADLSLTRISRTVDRFRLVDETTVSFTHNRELPWLLPGAAPTGQRAEVLAIAVVSFQRGRIRSQRILWDYATLTGQLRLGRTAHLQSEQTLGSLLSAAPLALLHSVAFIDRLQARSLRAADLVARGG